jgi:hypothetical protein
MRILFDQPCKSVDFALCGGVAGYPCDEYKLFYRFLVCVCKKGLRFDTFFEDGTTYLKPLP